MQVKRVRNAIGNNRNSRPRKSVPCQTLALSSHQENSLRHGLTVERFRDLGRGSFRSRGARLRSIHLCLNPGESPRRFPRSRKLRMQPQVTFFAVGRWPLPLRC